MQNFNKENIACVGSLKSSILSILEFSIKFLHAAAGYTEIIRCQG